MILEIDIGNSGLKWRLREGKTITVQGRSSREQFSGYDAFFDGIGQQINGSLQQVLVSTVVPTEQQALTEACFRCFRLSPWYADVVPACAGVVNGYKRVEQMGVDRWMAILAAHNLFAADCLVVDGGTALTVDLLLASGEHRGGYIVPGLSLMRHALFRDTDRVKLSEISYHKQPNVGQSTQTAVASGLSNMHLGLILLSLEELESQSVQTPRIILTGGCAKALNSMLHAYLGNRGEQARVKAIELIPSLVFDGLALAAKAANYNPGNC
ncbi:MAG: type III pantothenate kinase [Pseudomonadota bacterium]